MPRVATIFLVRHGETDWNRVGRWQGHADPPLNERGREQARDLARRLRRFSLDRAYSSDLRRARETAEILAGELGLELTLDRDLREIDVGEWSGLTRDEVELRYPEAFTRWRAHDGPGWTQGETHEQMRSRALAAILRIARDHAHQSVLVVSHGGPIRAVHSAAVGLDYLEYRRSNPVVANCGMSTLAIRDAEIRRLD